MSVSDLFILSQLDRGLETPYDLLRRAGLSLGATVPALRRLNAAGLIKREKESTVSNRPRHVYRLTVKGEKQARTGWKHYLANTAVSADLDEILRICDMAAHYTHPPPSISAFLERAAQDRSSLAAQAQIGLDRQLGAVLAYTSTRAACETERLKSEATVLARLAFALKESLAKKARRSSGKNRKVTTRK